MMSLLFEETDLPRHRRAPVKRMHVSDAGEGVIEFTCPHCGHCTGWIHDEWTVSKNRQGQPCPVCNTDAMLKERARHD